jgi:hypothetical protein
MNKYEQLIEHIINDDEAKARALFHEIVVEKSRDIYESLMDEDYTEEDIGGNQVQGLVDEISMDETDGIGEGDDEDNGEMDMEPEMGMDDMGDMDDMGGEQDLEQKVMDLETELEALKAEFEQLMGDEAGEEEHSDMEFGADDEDSEGDADMFGGDDEEAEEEMFEADDQDDEDDEEKMTESRRAYPKTAVDLMREYVEKISAPSNTEFTPVGTGAGGDKPAGNTKNPLAGKNDMGGTAQNIAKGGNENAPDGQRPNGKAGGFLKGAQEIDVAKRNVNKPGGNKGAQNWYSNKAKAKSGEGQTTDGSVPVQKKSIEPGGN